ncbi:MAG: 2-isopropylmalate synthase, partial [Thermoanaerobaculia bacterium]|nr:2-isopropylmalate synthase [Thermoanaerobaculia bacterium]
YSGIPAAMVGRRQEVEVGPMSGQANVLCWLQERGLEASPECVQAIFRAAKESKAVLSEERILALCSGFLPVPE